MLDFSVGSFVFIAYYFVEMQEHLRNNRTLGLEKLK